MSSSSEAASWVARIDPRLRVLYLFGLAIALFLVKAPSVVAAVVAAQVALALGAGIPLERVVRNARKLVPFGLALALTFAFFPEEGNPRWVTIPPGLTVSFGGLALAALMLARIFAIVLASDVARLGDPRAFAGGLRGLGAPRALATAIDVTLQLLGASGRGSGGGGGRGRGGGQGRHREPGEVPAAPGGVGRWRAFVGALARGDVRPLVTELNESLQRASAQVAHRSEPGTGLSAHDLGVVAGIATAMLALKILKILPGIPFAPGHKGVFLIPLYILAGALTRMRWGATLTGATMGTIAFLMGDGKYGVFEILKHVAPGVVVDLLLPVFRRGGREPGVVAWCVFGFLVALGRFATVVVITLLVAAPEQIWVLLAVPAVVHLVFGTLSGFVSYHLMRMLDEIRPAAAEEETPPAARRWR